ncbi:MAG: F0F1 ATP synthase subunit delta [Candidatus Omnitrophota bacterium]
MVQLVLLQVITFVIIIVALRFLFGTQLKSALSRLQMLHQESLEKEEIINKELERARIQSQSEIGRSQEEAKGILETARAKSEKMILDAAERVQIEAKKIIAEAEEKAKRLEHEILATVDVKAVDLAQELIRHTFTDKGWGALQAQLIDELIEDFKAVDKNRLSVQGSKVEVLTAIALTPEEERRLAEVLSAKLGRPITLEEKVDPALISGLVIKLGGLVVDGSLKNKLMRVVNALHLAKR